MLNIVLKALILYWFITSCDRFNVYFFVFIVATASLSAQICQIMYVKAHLSLEVLNQLFCSA